MIRQAACLLGALLILGLGSVQAQSDKVSFDVSLNSDQFFGFYPFFSGGYSFNEKVGFSFYGILWSGGRGGASGLNEAWGNWTEFGVGVSLTPVEGLDISPAIGVLGGSLLSSGGSGGAVLGDGVVPNLTVGLDQKKVEGELYFGYYLPVRNETVELTNELGEPMGRTSTLSFIHYWANLGYKASPFLSFGAHFEHLINSGGTEVEASSDVYQWIGPYIQFSSDKAFARFSAGGDLLEGNDSFYKLTVGFGI